MKLLFVTTLDPCVRSVATIARYIEVGRSLGHEVAVFGEPHPQLPAIPCSTQIERYDRAVFLIHLASDFPDVPHLARLLDQMPRQRRCIIDCWGRYNETVRLDHDFNHWEKLDNHQGWEWIDAFRAVSDTILQPTLSPLRQDVRSFLFHGYDPAVVKNRTQLRARGVPPSGGSDAKSYGAMYVGNNWQRWEQIRRFIEQVQPIRKELGRLCLAGWDWDRRPDWAVHYGVRGIDVDPEFLAENDVEVRGAARFDEVVDLLGQAHFCPVFHRPLFRALGFVANRTFETFSADSLPLLALPPDFVQAIYGPAALDLTLGQDPAAQIQDMLRRPEKYQEALGQTRKHLMRHHSFQRRFEELLDILES